MATTAKRPMTKEEYTKFLPLLEDARAHWKSTAKEDGYDRDELPVLLLVSSAGTVLHRESSPDLMQDTVMVGFDASVPENQQEISILTDERVFTAVVRIAIRAENEEEALAEAKDWVELADYWISRSKFFKKVVTIEGEWPSEL
jgi:hypothetical protein